MTKKNIEDLEIMDQNLLRKILDAPSKTPIVSLYLELGCVPIRYLLIYKRVMYLHHILNLDESHLVSKVFFAQMTRPSKGDWYLQKIKEDLSDLGIDVLNFEDI